MDDETLEKVAANLFQKFPVPKARLPASSVTAMTKSVGVELPDHLAEYLGDKAMKDLRYVILLATQFSRHERAFGLRESDCTKAMELINSFEGESRGQDTAQGPASSLAQDNSNSQEEAGSSPQVFLHRYSSDELEQDGEDLTTNSNNLEENKSAEPNEEEECWQDYTSTTTSSGDKESPGDSSEGSGSANGSANPEQHYEGPYSDERENHSDNNEDFDSKMLPDSCDNIENEIADEFLGELVEDSNGEHLDYVIQHVVLSS